MWRAYACRSILVLYLLCKNDLYFFNSNAKFSPRCSLDEWLWVVCPEWLCFGSRLRTFIILQVVLPVESFVKMYKLAINFSSETPFGETQNWGFKFSSIVYLLTACYLWFLLGNWLKINETAQELNKMGDHAVLVRLAAIKSTGLSFPRRLPTSSLLSVMAGSASVLRTSDCLLASN